MSATFGIEIETEHGDVARVCRELHALGLATTPERRPRGLTWKRTPTSWRAEADPTLNSATGLELISHPVTGGPAADRFWGVELPTVLEVLTRWSAEPTPACAFHVHIGVGSLGTDRHAWKHLVRAAEARLEHHRGRGLRPGARLTFPTVDRYATGRQVIAALGAKTSFLSTAYLVKGLRPTVEWRVPDSTLALEEIRDEVAWLQQAVEHAAELVTPSPYTRGIPLRGLPLVAA